MSSVRLVQHEECNKDQLWFQFGDQFLYLLLTEWYLVTGLCYGAKDVHKKIKSYYQSLV